MAFDCSNSLIKIGQSSANSHKKYGQYGDRTRDIRVISTTL